MISVAVSPGLTLTASAWVSETVKSFSCGLVRTIDGAPELLEDEVAPPSPELLSELPSVEPPAFASEVWPPVTTSPTASFRFETRPAAGARSTVSSSFFSSVTTVDSACETALSASAISPPLAGWTSAAPAASALSRARRAVSAVSLAVRTFCAAVATPDCSAVFAVASASAVERTVSRRDGKEVRIASVSPRNFS